MDKKQMYTAEIMQRMIKTNSNIKPKFYRFLFLLFHSFNMYLFVVLSSLL